LASFVAVAGAPGDRQGQDAHGQRAADQAAGSTALGSGRVTLVLWRAMALIVTSILSCLAPRQ
jgi:hypothetical protein